MAEPQLNVDQAVASGIAATQPVATTTRPNAPGIPPPEDPTGGFQSTLQVESPQWAGLPSQQDFGQVDPRRGNYNTGMVPTVNVQMPFAALANRQMALGQRKAALDKQVADFDLYSKVGSPDARYSQAYNRYATTEMDRKLKEYADAMHGGDTRSAIRDIATNPEAKRMWDGWSRNTQAVADENKKWMSVNDERLAKHFSGEAFIRDPKALEAMMRFAASVDENRTPIGADGSPLDAGDFVRTARTAVPEIQRLQYMEQILPALKEALQTSTGIDIAGRTRDGKIIINSQEVKSWDAAKKSILKEDERIIDMFDGDYKRAEEFLDAMLPTSVKEDMKFENPYTPPSGGSGSGRTPPQGALTVNYAKLPQGIWRNFPDAKNVGAGMDFPYIPISDVVSGQGKTPHPRAFASPDQGGSEKFIIPERLIKIGNKLFVSGKEAVEPGASKTGGTSMSFTMDDGNIQEFKVLGDKVVPYEGNESRLEAYFPWLSAGVIDEKLRDTKPRGGNPQQSKAQETKLPTASQFDAEWSKLPKGGTLTGPDGKTYTKQ
jgi:hypothetical protein